MTILLAGAESVVGAAGSLLGFENYRLLTQVRISESAVFTGIRTGAIMDRFSNAAVEAGVERFFRVVASPEAKRDMGQKRGLRKLA